MRIRQRPQDVVVLDGSDIDRLTTPVLIAPKQCRDVAEGMKALRVQMPPRSIIGIPDVGELDVQQGDDPSVEVMKLTSVPDDG